MFTLFPVQPVLPEGFLYFPDFLSETEEMSLLSDIREIALHPFKFQGFEAKRKVASFGYDYNFSDKALLKGAEIPPVFNDLLEKVAMKLNVKKEVFKEVLLTEYPVGSVINWHRDAFPFDRIAGISLQSDCIFRLRPHTEAKRGRSNITSLPLERRSLYIMQGPARMYWQHSIAPVKNVRYSITMRTLRT